MVSSVGRVEWTDEDVRAFISGQLNSYGFEVSPERSKHGTSRWKRWLWLEKHGFDFVHQSLDAEIFHFRMDHSPMGVLLEDERRLLIRVREVMRSILSMEPLSEQEKRDLLSVVPVSNHTHWASAPRRFGPQDMECDPGAPRVAEAASLAWDFMIADRPHYLDILRRIHAYAIDDPEVFEDNYTINGSYSLLLSPNLKKDMYLTVSDYYIRRLGDMCLVPGNLKTLEALRDRVLQHVETAISGG